MSTAAEASLLVFEIGRAEARAQDTSPSTLFAIDVSWVLQVHEPELIVPVPLAPAVVQGVLNLHGRIITVIDPAPLFGLQPQSPPVTHAVILRDRGGLSGHLGLEVTRTREIVPAARLTAEDVHRGLCVERVVRSGRDLVHVVAYDDLLSRLNEHFSGPERTGIESRGASP